jgi:hypothetical protein
MKPQHVRPEDRHRSGVDGLARETWLDTRPACFRSEGFAEDLPEDAVQAGGMVVAATRLATQYPLLGVVLAGVLGVFGR